MSAPMNLASLLDELAESENIVEKLNDIKTLLVSIHPNNLRDVVPNISFNVVFAHLNSEDRCVRNQDDLHFHFLKYLLI